MAPEYTPYLPVTTHSGFEGESPENFEQKCLCVLVVDVSASMAGEAIQQLNNGLKEFQKEVLNDFVASQRLEIALVTFGNSAQTLVQPTLANQIEMPTLVANGGTKLVDGVRTALALIEERKKWYKETGQNYYRPMTVLITDGEPDPDQDVSGLSQEVGSAIASKKTLFYSLGVKGYNHQKLAQINATPPPLPLDGYKFSEFFKWLSNSIGIITKSKEGDVLRLPSTNDWTQIQM